MLKLSSWCKKNRNDLGVLIASISMLGFMLGAINGMALPIVWVGVIVSSVVIFGIKLKALYAQQSKRKETYSVKSWCKENRNDLGVLIASIFMLGFVIASTYGMALPVMYVGVTMSFIIAFGLKLQSIN